MNNIIDENIENDSSDNSIDTELELFSYDDYFYYDSVLGKLDTIISNENTIIINQNSIIEKQDNTNNYLNNLNNSCYVLCSLIVIFLMYNFLRNMIIVK